MLLRFARRPSVARGFEVDQRRRHRDPRAAEDRAVSSSAIRSGAGRALGIRCRAGERQGQDQRRRRRRRARRGDRGARGRAAAMAGDERTRRRKRAYASPIRSESDRPAARRQRAHGAVQLAARARQGRHVHPAHRGHRHRAIDARVGGRHPRGSALARTRLGRGAGRRRRRTARIASRSGCTCTRRMRTSCWPAATRTTASARRQSSRTIARRILRPAVRRNTAAPAATSPPDEARGAHRRRRTAGHPLQRARARRGQLPGSRPRRSHRSAATSSAIRCWSDRTAGRPTTSPSWSTMR